MSGRPEILYPLFAALDTLAGVGPKTAKTFAQMEVEKPRDLLFTLPYSGIDRRHRASIQGVDLPAVVTVEVEVGRHLPAARTAVSQAGQPSRARKLPSIHSSRSGRRSSAEAAALAITRWVTPAVSG